MIITRVTSDLVSDFEYLKANKKNMSPATYKKSLQNLIKKIDNELISDVGITKEQSDLLRLLTTV